MRLVASTLGALFILIGCQQDINHEYSDVSIKDQDDNVLVTAADFEDASVQEEQGRLLVTVNFKDSAEITEISEEYLNEEVHVYLGDEELASPSIRTVINSDSIQMDGDYTKAEAERFVDAINH